MSSASFTHSSWLFGSGASSGRFSPSEDRASTGLPVSTETASNASFNWYWSRMVLARAASCWARASCTSVIAVKPTSKRCSACSSWRATAFSCARAASRFVRAVSALKYVCAVRRSSESSAAS